MRFLFDNIDWAATGSMISGIGSLAAAVTVLGAALIGRNTFNQWRRQKSEERRIDLAEQVLTAVYRCRSNLNYARSSIEWSVDQEKAEQILKDQGLITPYLEDWQRRRMISAQIVITRMHRGNEWERIDELSPVCTAVFGSIVVDELRALERQRNAVFVAARRYASNSLNPPPANASEEVRQRHSDKFYEVQNRIWNMGTDDEPDEINKGVEVAIKALESHLLPIIRAGT